MQMLTSVNSELKRRIPGVIVSSPDASIYSVIDVRNIVDRNFEARDFVMYCAREGAVEVDGEMLTLLVAPMEGFYSVAKEGENPGKTQMRIAYVEPPERMQLMPLLFSKLFTAYTGSIADRTTNPVYSHE
jgi:aspartate aminotransferase